jgi:hypothetical protein
MLKNLMVGNRIELETVFEHAFLLCENKKARAVFYLLRLYLSGDIFKESG